MKAPSATLELEVINEAHWAALREGRLLLQRCECGQRWAPPRASCPACLGSHWSWESVQGGGRLKSWIVYHTAFSDAFRDRLPYNVALVELDEGVSVITNIVADNALLSAEARVRFIPVVEGDRTLARFELV